MAYSLPVRCTRAPLTSLVLVSRLTTRSSVWMTDWAESLDNPTLAEAYFGTSRVSSVLRSCSKESEVGARGQAGFRPVDFDQSGMHHRVDGRRKRCRTNCQIFRYCLLSDEVPAGSPRMLWIPLRLAADGCCSAVWILLQGFGATAESA
jgi:hypothetical protein